MDNIEYLNEERYQKSKKKISIIALTVLIIGLLIGGTLIVLGIININNNNSKYSDESKAELISKLEAEKNNLETKKAELISKGIEYDVFADYDDGEVYDLFIITKTLDPSFDNCAFNEYKNNELTKKYCSLKSELEQFENGFSKNIGSAASIPLFMIAAFVISSTLMIFGFIFMISKRREITAFGVQQVMPIAKEGIEKMAPSIGKAGKSIAKEMAPVYGDIAKEISKGIKDGLKTEENK